MVRILKVSLLGFLCAVIAPGAFAQQAKFEPAQCEGRTAQDCNDLMGSLNVSPAERQQVLLARATALLQKHDLEGSIAEYREMTVIDPKSLMAYSTLGFLESIGEKWDAAATDLKRAIEIAPDQERIRSMLAVALAKGGDCSSAKAALEEEKARFKDESTTAKAEQTVNAVCH